MPKVYFFMYFGFDETLSFFRISKYKSDCGPMKGSFKPDWSEITGSLENSHQN